MNISKNQLHNLAGNKNYFIVCMSLEDNPRFGGGKNKHRNFGAFTHATMPEFSFESFMISKNHEQNIAMKYDQACL
jgi:hypothetical protein